jgi:hypothetical protein
VEVSFTSDDVAVIDVDPTQVEAVAGELLAGGAGSVEVDQTVEIQVVTPTDPNWSQWWGARQMDFPSAWSVTRGQQDGNRTVLAVLDTGVAPVTELTNPENRLLGGADCSGETCIAGAGTTDTNGHGTQAAVVAAGAINNGIGAGGACPDCEVLPVRVLTGSTGSMARVAAGIDWAVDNGADVINVSLGGATDITALRNAVTKATQAGVPVIASAGNAGARPCTGPGAGFPCATTPLFPAANPTVIGVAGLRESGTLEYRSSRGVGVDTAGPWCNVGQRPGNAIVVWFCGTSSAAPMVAGAVALLRTVAPTASVATIRNRVRVASLDGYGLGWGLLRAPNLLANTSPAFPRSGFTDVPNNTWFTVPVNWARATAVTTGVGGSNRFEPWRDITRAEVVTMLWRAVGSPNVSPSAGFVDVPGGTWFTTAVNWAKDFGITTGVGGSNRFEPLRPITRAEVVTMLWRATGSPTGYPRSGFIDVPRGTWYTASTDWAKATGVTTGVGGSNRFEPLRPITRGEVVTMLWRD